ncbi:hypothetical protein ACRCUN_04525 [Mycobacterium sp. LTG2003]
MCSRDSTPSELEFETELEALVPGLDYWLREDDDCTPWLCVSRDFCEGPWIVDTLRLDVDTAGLRGGWSPRCLNGDDGMRAEAAGVDVAGPDGICLSAANRSGAELARLAAEWFLEHERRWPKSGRAGI